MKDWLEDNFDYNQCTVLVELDAPQTSRTGHMLNDLLYKNQDLVEMAPGFSGSPHSGGIHRCFISGNRVEVIAWLDLVVSEYPDWETAALRVKGEIRRLFLKADWRRYGRINVQLKKLEVLVPVQGNRPTVKSWFQGEWENEDRKSFQPSRRKQAAMK